MVQSINYNGAKQAAYQYNKVGELVKMDDWTGTNTFEVDLLGQPKKLTGHEGFRMLVSEITYATHEYDDVRKYLILPRLPQRQYRK